MPARSESAGLSMVAWTQSVRLFSSMRLSMAETAPSKAFSGIGQGRSFYHCADLDGGGEALGHPEIDKDAGPIVNRGDGGLVSHIVAGLDGQDADNARNGRGDRAAVEGDLRVVDAEFVVAQRQLCIGQLYRRRRVGGAQRPRAVDLGLGVVACRLGALQRNFLGFGIQLGNDLSGLDMGARLDEEFGQPAGGIRVDGHGRLGATGADSLKLVVDGGGRHLRGDDGRLGAASTVSTAPIAFFLAARGGLRRRGLCPFYAPAGKHVVRAGKEPDPGRRGNDQDRQREYNLFPGGHRRSGEENVRLPVPPIRKDAATYLRHARSNVVTRPLWQFSRVYAH